MIPRQPFSIRNALFKLLILCASLLLFYGLFLGATSLWVGLSHRQQEGFWAPTLAGGLLIVLIVWLYVRLVLALTRAMRRSDILNP
jgi:hypothetical protein